MIFGKTDAERAADHQKAISTWTTGFAWFPRLLVDGRWAWLERIEYTHYGNPTVPYWVRRDPVTLKIYRAVGVQP